MPKMNDTPQPNPEYQVATKVFKAFRDTWIEQGKEAGVDPMDYSKLSLVAMAQLAAIVAVDIHMPQDNFQNVCRACFEQAYKNAPKFG